MNPHPMDFARQHPSNRLLYRASAMVLALWLAGAVVIIGCIWMLSVIAESVWGY